MKNSSKFYKCSCGAHALEIDTSFRKEEGETYFSIWELGRCSDVLSWRERLRWCWRIIKTGKPWADSVVLKDEQVRELVEQLKNDNCKSQIKS